MRATSAPLLLTAAMILTKSWSTLKVVMNTKKRTFKLFWLTKEVDTITSPDLGNQLDTLANAMSLAGFGGGSLTALDYWKEIENEDRDK